MNLMFFLCLCFHAIGDEVLFASSFTSDNFVTNEGWGFYSRTSTDIGIGQFESQNYIGLITLSGQEFRGDGLFKLFYSLPPHYAIRVKGTLLFQTLSFYEYNEGQIFIDGQMSVAKNIIRYRQQMTPVKQDIKSDFDTIQLHYSTTILIQVYFGQSYKNSDSTLGFRNFKLYILTCPVGCESCDNAIACNEWKLQYRSLTKTQFTLFDTEGWYISYNSNNLDKNSYISIINCKNLDSETIFLGLAKLNQQIVKTIELPLHYKVKVSYFQLLYSLLQQYQYTWMVEIDGSVVTTVKLNPKFNPPHICQYTYDATQFYGEVIKKVTFEQSHNGQFLNFVTQPVDFIFGDQYAQWGIRDFEIYLKKCHASCIYACKGPSAQDCQDDILYKSFSFYQAFSENTFTLSDGWQMIKDKGLSFKRCMESVVSTNTNYFQGDNYFQKQYQITQSHTSISISFTLYQIDKFTGEKLFVLVDDVEVKQVTLSAVTSIDGLPLCSVDDDFDKRIIVNITNIAHTQNILIVQIYTNQIVTATGFWGIRNFALTVDKKLISTEFSNLNLVSDDWKDWKYTSLLNVLSLCSGKTIFGGSSQLDQSSTLRKIIKSIPEHQKVKIEFQIFLLAPSDKQIKLKFSIDGLEVYGKILRTQTMALCGPSINSNFFTVEEIYPHSNSQVFLLITTENSDNLVYTWGIRNFKLSYYQRYIYSG